jgi:hypothetical protein
MGGRVGSAVDIVHLSSIAAFRRRFHHRPMIGNRKTDGRQVWPSSSAASFWIANLLLHVDFTTLSGDDMRAELERTDAAVAARSKLTLRPLFGRHSGRGERVRPEDGQASRYRHRRDVGTTDCGESAGGPTKARSSTGPRCSELAASCSCISPGTIPLPLFAQIIDGLRTRGFEAGHGQRSVGSPGRQCSDRRP